MTNLIVVGAQWGDEGKAKIVDYLAESADVVVRSQGGCNAGHTVKHNGQTFKFHHLPSGLLYNNKLCVIGSGVVILPHVLAKELESIESQGYSLKGLRISNRAHVTLPFHNQQDNHLEGVASSKTKIGTTGRGIGPTYMDKVARVGLRVCDLMEPAEVLIEQLLTLEQQKRPVWEKVYNLPFPSIEELLSYCQQAKAILAPYVCDTVSLLAEAQQQGQNLLFEGAQGTLLDVDFGTYPYVTSSNATAGGACTGTGVGPSKIDRTLGVMKAYLTRVGEGPFPTELFDEAGAHLATVGQEIGTTTGRARRCGWFDAVIGRYSVAVNGLNGMALTKLDVLSGLPEIKIAVAYHDPQTDKPLEAFPASISQLQRAEPVYETWPGWQEPLDEITRWEQLPANCQAYLARLEALCGCPIDILSLGPSREQTLFRHHPFKPLAVEAIKTPAANGV